MIRLVEGNLKVSARVRVEPELGTGPLGTVTGIVDGEVAIRWDDGQPSFVLAKRVLPSVPRRLP